MDAESNADADPDACADSQPAPCGNAQSAPCRDAQPFHGARARPWAHRPDPGSHCRSGRRRRHHPRVIDGQDFALRYIGIDTPETVHPSKPVEWMGAEASAANHTLVDGKTVVLEKDVSEVDRYGRLLRYVWLNDGGAWLLANRELVRLGFAQVSTYPPDVKYTELLLDAQREARESGLGLWGDPPVPSESPIADDGCDPAYPTVCIPAPPPDLDCAEIPYRRFGVLPPDPHNFDGDHNGIGCELGVR
jgi:micrococcal nuclease